MTSLDAAILLNMAPGIGSILVRRCIETFGSAEGVLEATGAQLAMIQGIGSRRAGEIKRGIDELVQGDALASERHLMEEHGVYAVAMDDPTYPPLLRHISDPPLVLYVRGSLDDHDATSLAVVGSRKCTLYGREQADRFVSVLASAGVTIVSGGAFGIDAAAHRAAVRAGGRTIAVVGSGLCKPYPDAHAELFEQVAQHGAVVSEFPMTTPPRAENFPRRNRIISGWSLGVLVVEAAVRSGALITARLAGDDHGREVMAIPGRVDSPASAGCHQLLRSGAATLVTSAAEVLEAMGEAGQTLKASLTVTADGSPTAAKAPASLFENLLTDSQKKILAALADPLPLDLLSAATGLAIHVLQADLTMLQIRGLVQKDRGQFRAAR